MRGCLPAHFRAKEAGRIEFLRSTNTGAAELFIALYPALTIVGQPGAAYRIEAAEATSAGTPLQWIAVDTVRLAGETHHWFDPQPVKAPSASTAP